MTRIRDWMDVPSSSTARATKQILVNANPGKLIAQTLAGAWRQSPPPLHISDCTLNEVAPLLLRTGAAALAWRRVAYLGPSASRPASELQQAYRQHSIESAIHEQQITDVFQRMRAAVVEPLLIKGWAMARLYPEPGLRPYGDIDLWVPPSRMDAAAGALISRTNEYCVELHSAFYEQFERSLDDVLARSQLVLLDDLSVRIPCLEDHLRFLCLHFLGHGAWRPLWLCDIALAVESRGPDFEWDRCLKGTPKHADWIACTIGLAYQLLGADVTGTPVEERAHRLPRWLVPAVLEQWGEGAGMSFADTLTFSLPHNILRPVRLARSFREHWRNPIQARVELDVWFDERRRPLLQLAAMFRRVPDFTKQLQLRRQRRKKRLSP